ncbi:MAG: hypothetical protein M1120_02190 [Patescibacteria group bacterium]|nr:hypothetical protein [Patescibacteria group bacterium]
MTDNKSSANLDRKSRSILVLVDGNAVLHRAYHALPTLTTRSGQFVNAVYGFASMLIRVVKELSPDYLVVCFDRPKPTFRQSIYVAYQHKRPQMDEELAGQIETVHKLVESMDLPIYEKDGYEADDVIGTLATKFEKLNEDIIALASTGPASRPVGSRFSPACRQAGTASKPPFAVDSSKTDQLRRLSPDNVDSDKSSKNLPNTFRVKTIIVTGDRDLLQLVDKDINIYMMTKGISESEMYGEEEVKKKFGIKPSQIIDYKALIGDSSDNYPGVPGVGPKTAVELLQEFGSLDNIYKNLNKIKKEKIANLLKEGKESAYLSRQLATILTKVPLKPDWEKARIKNLGSEKALKMMEDLEFYSLIKRLTGKNKEEENKEQKDKGKENQLGLF